MTTTTLHSPAMPWMAPAELEKQARLEIERTRDALASRLDHELAQLTEQYGASGLGKSSDLLNALEEAATKHFASYASQTTEILVDVLRESHGTVPIEAEAWIRQVFETYLSPETVRLWQILERLAKQVDATDYDAPGGMNQALFRARKDLDIRLGRIRIQQSATLAGQQSTATAAEKQLKDLPQREALHDDLDTVLKSGVLVSVLFIDLDGFKQVNDTNGHAAGDRCLETVAELLQAAVADKGAVYRYGGDEFVAILSNFDVDEAAATGERIRRAIADAKPGGELGVSASVGVASSQHSSLRSAPALLSASDQAMYVSKHGGGNRVTQSSRVSPVDRPGQSSRVVSPERIKHLVELTEFAVHRLLNDPQRDSANNLTIRVDAWEAQVLSALTESDASEVDKSWFRVLSTYSPAKLDGATPEHAKIRNELAEKIERLRDITRRLEDRLRTRR